MLSAAQSSDNPNGVRFFNSFFRQIDTSLRLMQTMDLC
ncbi:hypothetical protein Z949_1796 [Sulfitobacter guttiformis KCTC 32187]|nr:hypothetical protein Z949_1796 [Sulfitobacter guttiformis KCTC 32187]